FLTILSKNNPSPTILNW
ncbi:hypothetical protein CWATWH0003_0319c3, partial [Crocosphaera watsonii WH 0003]